VRRDPDFQPIAPRPVRREPEAQPIRDNAPAGVPDADKGIREDDRPSTSEILLQAITNTARKEPQTPTTRDALRVLIFRFSTQCGLDF